MKNEKIMWKITQGMYVLTTKEGGCVVDAVSQVSAGESPLISVSVMKKNNTNELMKQGKRFAISVLGKKVNPEIIVNFGFHSSRDYNKLETIELEQICDVPVVKDSLGYLICEIVDQIDCDTHTLFLGKVIEADLWKEMEEPMSYGYYQEHKEDLLKVTSKQGKTMWICTICGYVYEGEELPDDFLCPICKAGKEFFKKKE